MTELTLFDTTPADVPETGCTPTLYATNNTDHGHLLLATHVGDWMFVWTGGGYLRAYFPGFAEGIDLESSQLRTMGDYFLRMAERMEGA